VAIAGNIEWKLEQAFVDVLAAADDLTTADVRRYRDARTEPNYDNGAVTVACSGARDQSFAVRTNYAFALVELQCITYNRDDTQGVEVTDLLGAVRDKIYSDSFILDLTGAVSGLIVYAVLIEDPTLNLDTNRLRRRSLTCTVHARAQDIG